MNTRDKYLLFRWLKTVGKFQDKTSLPKNSALIEQLRSATGQNHWTHNQLKEFARRKGVEFPELKCGSQSFQKPSKNVNTPKRQRILIQPIKSGEQTPAKPTSFQMPQIDPLYSREKYVEFMASEGWRCVRYMALRKYGNHCRACGRGPEDSVKIHVDHIVPCSRGWDRRLEISNLQILCEDCNMGKGAHFADDWRR